MWKTRESFNEKFSLCAPLLFPLMSGWCVAILEVQVKTGSFSQASAECIQAPFQLSLLYSKKHNNKSSLERCVGWTVRRNSVNGPSWNIETLSNHAGMGLRKAKAHLDLKLVREVKGNLKGFCRLFSRKRKTRENMIPLLNGEGDLLTKNAEKDTVLCDFFTLIFVRKVSLQWTQACEESPEVQNEQDLPLVKENKLREHLNKQDTHNPLCLTWYTYYCWGSWLTSLQGHCFLS